MLIITPVSKLKGQLKFEHCKFPQHYSEVKSFNIICDNMFCLYQPKAKSHCSAFVWL